MSLDFVVVLRWLMKVNGEGQGHLLSHVFRILQHCALYRLHTHSTTIAASLVLYNSMLLDAYWLG